MNKYMRNLTTAVLGATMAFSVMGTPLASAGSKSEAKDYKQVETRQDYKHQYNKRPGQERPYYNHGYKYNPNNYRVHSNGVVTYEHSNYSIDENGTVYNHQGSYYKNSYTSPVSAAKAAAADYGLNTNRAKFNLVSQSSNKALVKIVQSGKTYYANLAKTMSGHWYVTTIYRS